MSSNYFSVFLFPQQQQVVLKSEHNAFRCSLQLRKHYPGRGQNALGNLLLSEGNWVDCLGQERISLEQTHCLFIFLFLPHSITLSPLLATIWGPPSPRSLLLEDRGVEIGTKWRDGMHATEGTILIKMFAQKIISRVALLIMTNACKGSTRKTHGVWGCSPWKRARTVFYPPSNGSGTALLLLLFLTEAACLATRWCDFVVNWVIAFTAARWLFNPDVKSQVGCSATQTCTHIHTVHMYTYTSAHYRRRN